MYEPPQQLKVKKIQSNNNFIIILCPLRFTCADKKCIKDECAWWLPIQRACCVQVLARGIGINQND